VTGDEYLEIVRDSLPGVLDAVRPDLVVYNAGWKIHADAIEGILTRFDRG
jgi:acetoin utilization deacetylase AcuC-like enzyme